MAQAILTILLWLFVINLGIAFGARLYESRIVVPSGSAARRSPDTGGTPRQRVKPTLG